MQAESNFALGLYPFFIRKGVIAMRTLQEQLIEKGLSRKKVLVMDKAVKPKEAFSKRDIEELMGCHRPTYRKVNGVTKRKR